MRLTIPPEMVRATNFRHPPHVEIGPDGNAHIYDAEEADSTRRQYDRALGPNRAAPSPDHVPTYPIQQSEGAAPTRLPAGSFGVERPLAAGPHFSQVHPESARARAGTGTNYSWSPPPTPGDSSTPPHSARSSLPWTPTGMSFHHEAHPTPEHEPYYPQPQEHPSASPSMNQRELYSSYSHHYTRTGAPAWSPRPQNSPDNAHRRISSTQNLGSLTQNQNPNHPSYNSPYVDGHRRGEYDSAATRGP